MFWWFAKEFGSSHGCLHWWSAWSFGTRSPGEIHIKREGTFLGNLWGVASVDGFRHIIYIYYIYTWLHHYIILHIYIYTHVVIYTYIYIYLIYPFLGRSNNFKQTEMTLTFLNWWVGSMRWSGISGPRPLKMVVSKFGISGFQGPGPHFQGRGPGC